MRCLNSALLFFAASAAACGGRVEDPVPTSTTGSNSPSSAPAATGCEGACDRFRDCTTAFDDREACVSSCGREFPDPTRALAYARCIQALPCDQIERGLSMNYGPIGACYAEAGKR